VFMGTLAFTVRRIVRGQVAGLAVQRRADHSGWRFARYGAGPAPRGRARAAGGEPRATRVREGPVDRERVHHEPDDADAVAAAGTARSAPGSRAQGHDGPYVSHLLAVTGLVLEAGDDERQAIAALHDAVEDLPTAGGPCGKSNAGSGGRCSTSFGMHGRLRRRRRLERRSGKPSLSEPALRNTDNPTS
jgi:hypothetical protein